MPPLSVLLSCQTLWAQDECVHVISDINTITRAATITVNTCNDRVSELHFQARGSEKVQEAERKAAAPD